MGSCFLVFRISHFQLYCILLLLVGPVAFLETPNILIIHLGCNAWLAAIGTIVPGILLAAMFQYIIKKSSQPFPLLLEEHLGKILGKLLGFLYIPAFLLASSFTLRLFVDFIVTNVLPQTPISVFIGVLLLVGLVAIKSGLENLARCCELVVILGLPFAFLIFLIAIIENWNPGNLLPFARMDLTSFSLGLSSCSYVLGKMLPVLSLAFFCPRQEKIRQVMLLAIFSYVALMLATTLATLMTLDTTMSNIATFPTFSTIRLLHIADFIRNIDIVFIGIWILGVFGSVSIPWFMACYTTQQLFALKDYRFLAAPSSLIIGVFSILMSKNIMELLAVSMHIIPLLYSFVFILLPFLLFLLTLFKPYPESETLSEPEAKAESSA